EANGVWCHPWSRPLSGARERPPAACDRRLRHILLAGAGRSASVGCADVAPRKLRHALRPTTLRFHGGVPNLRSGRSQAIAGLVAAGLMVSTCGGPPSSRRPSSPAAPPLPPGLPRPGRAEVRLPLAPGP